VAGGAGILALLAGYFLVKRRRSQNASVETTALPVPSSLGPNSVFRMTGGQSIDTGNIAPMTGEFSQTGPGTIDTDEVDPVAEADVYMAYGRDTQAEEILLEALQKDPQRTAIHAKLLEIYANRRSVKQFETLAGELYTQTTGVGPDWEKAVALGLSLDPKNPLYATSSGRDAPAVVATSALDEAPLVSVQEEPVQQTVSDETPPIPGLTPEFERDTNILPTAAESAADQVVDAAAPQVPDLGSDAMTLDFDLGVETIAPDFVDEPEPVVVEKDAFVDTVVTVDDSNALDFDFGGDSEPVAAVLPVEESPRAVAWTSTWR
jgi:pilus assembly protein FimV